MEIVMGIICRCQSGSSASEGTRLGNGQKVLWLN